MPVGSTALPMADAATWRLTVQVVWKTFPAPTRLLSREGEQGGRSVRPPYRAVIIPMTATKLGPGTAMTLGTEGHAHDGAGQDTSSHPLRSATGPRMARPTNIMAQYVATATPATSWDRPASGGEKDEAPNAGAGLDAGFDGGERQTAEPDHSRREPFGARGPDGGVGWILGLGRDGPRRQSGRRRRRGRFPGPPWQLEERRRGQPGPRPWLPQAQRQLRPLPSMGRDHQGADGGAEAVTGVHPVDLAGRRSAWQRAR